MTHYILVESCHRCPYCSGLHPDLLVGWEALSCGHTRMTSLSYPDDDDDDVNKLDRFISQYFRNAGDHGEPALVPPDWCPLESDDRDYIKPISTIRMVRV